MEATAFSQVRVSLWLWFFPTTSRLEEGRSEGFIMGKFEEAKKKSPAVMVIEDIDVLISKDLRGELELRLFGQLLEAIDDLSGRIFVIGTGQSWEVLPVYPSKPLFEGVTNRINAIAREFRCAGRLESSFEVRVETSQQRYDILRLVTKDILSLVYVSP